MLAPFLPMWTWGLFKLDVKHCADFGIPCSLAGLDYRLFMLLVSCECSTSIAVVLVVVHAERSVMLYCIGHSV